LALPDLVTFIRDHLEFIQEHAAFVQDHTAFIQEHAAFIPDHAEFIQDRSPTISLWWESKKRRQGGVRKRGREDFSLKYFEQD
jgi:hypothetical protein